MTYTSSYPVHPTVFDIPVDAENLQSKIARIQKMRDDAAAIPEKDAVGIYIPQGIDAAVKVKVLNEVLKVLEE